jgi:hypothetical protein
MSSLHHVNHVVLIGPVKQNVTEGIATNWQIIPCVNLH